jgi:hypothetical protein
MRSQARHEIATPAVSLTATIKRSEQRGQAQRSPHYAPPTPTITLPVPPQTGHFEPPLCLPFPWQCGQIFSPVPGVPGLA